MTCDPPGVLAEGVAHGLRHRAHVLSSPLLDRLVKIGRHPNGDLSHLHIVGVVVEVYGLGHEPMIIPAKLELGTPGREATISVGLICLLILGTHRQGFKRPRDDRHPHRRPQGTG